MMSFGMQMVLLAILSTVSMVLQGCTFGSGTTNCNGEDCDCSWTFHSFWARIRIGDVPIEHASRAFYVPDVARDVPNASAAPCCNAIFEQIDYDEGKTASMPNTTVAAFRSGCTSSPNQEIAAAATGVSPAAFVDGVVGRKLRSTHRQADAQPNQHLYYQPIDDEEEGEDCDISTHHGFPLNNVPISSGSMKLVIKWVDPEKSSTCCDALQPILEHVYLKRLPESILPSNMKNKFCNSCKRSPNQGIALAAYRCFSTGNVSVV